MSEHLYEESVVATDTRIRRWSVLGTIVLCLLAACRGAPPVSEEREPASPPSVHEESAERFTVDTASSELKVLVYRAGPLAKLGHNHVVSSRDISGTVWLEDRAGRSAFRLELPLAALVIDDPEDRKAAGANFPGEIPAEDISATKKNMLSDRLLDAANHPVLLLRGSVTDLREGDMRVPMDIFVRGKANRIELPISFQRSARRLLARGDTTVTHDQLGLEPFSVMMGALSIAEEIGLSYRIVATRDD